MSLNYNLLIVTESGKSWSRNSKFDFGVDQRFGFTGAPAQHGRYGAGSHGRPSSSPSARENRNVEPRSAHQHFLGC